MPLYNTKIAHTEAAKMPAHKISVNKATRFKAKAKMKS